MLQNFLLFCVFIIYFSVGTQKLYAQSKKTITNVPIVKKQYTIKDTLLGSLNPNRDWWNVVHYNIVVEPDISNKSLSGSVEIEFQALKTGHILQIDLQEPLQIDSIFEIEFYKKKRNPKRIPIRFKTDSFTTLVSFQKSILKHQVKKIMIYYHGKVHEALNAPWDGGLVWGKDSFNNPFISVACQGIGASIWYPCKDHLSDEPDNGMDISIITPDSLVAVSNGNFISKQQQNNKTTAWQWRVVNPINNYNINFTIGKLVNFYDTLHGEKGVLPLNFWVLDYHLKQAQEHFKIVKPILHCFEYWFGPYPFYEDGYQVIETPFLGMEHQSAIAYGNQYKNGYKGNDLSKTNWGLKWDFILVHETGHEWFGNNISIADRADMWIHESFTNYSETLFTEYFIGDDASNEYCYGIRHNIKNDIPIIAPYGVNAEGSSDMYYKGGNLLHSIRNAMYDDKRWRQFLRLLHTKFYHQIVTTPMIEKELCDFFAYDFKPVLKQYLTTTQIPELAYYFEDGKIVLRWENCVNDFNLPIVIPNNKGYKQIYPTTTWQQYPSKASEEKWWTGKQLEKFFYVKTKKALFN